MNEKEIPLAIERHTTSKIFEASDLFRLKTMGFRGEALSSICSISKMTLTSAKEDAMGLKIEVQAGSILSSQPCARVRGTTIEIHSLFYNVPARKKFQKSAAACSAESFRIVLQLALGFPQVGFQLISNGQVTIDVPASSEQLAGAFLERCDQLFGSHAIKEGYPLNFQKESFSLFGYLGSPGKTRPNRQGQYLFINQRAVVCPAISDAVRQAYATRLSEHRYPEFYVHMQLDPALIDFNVHPQKKEVRLRDERFIREMIGLACGSCFGQEQAIFSNDTAFSFPSDDLFSRLVLREETGEFVQQTLPIENSSIEPIAIIDRFALFLKGSDLLYVADLAAMARRVFFEESLKRSAQGAAQESQIRLIPISVSMNPVQQAMLLTHLSIFEELGFTIRPITLGGFLVEALPPLFDETKVEQGLREMAENMQSFIGKESIHQAKERSLMVIASRFVDWKRFSTVDGARTLLEKWQELGAVSTCPSQTQILKQLDRDEFEKLLF